MNDHESIPRAGNYPVEAELHELVRRLVDAEATIQALIAGNIDAVVDPVSLDPILLRQTQEALLESESRYRRLVERMAALVFEMDPDGTIRFVNEAVEKVTGFRPEQLQGLNWLDVFFPGELRQQVMDLETRFQAGDVSKYELILEARNGSLVTLELNSANRYRPDGSLERIIGFGVDITERKWAQLKLIHNMESLKKIGEELRVSEEELRVQNEGLIAAQEKVIEERQRYHELFDFAPDGYLVTNAQGIIQEANRAAAYLLRVRPEYLVGKPLAIYVAENERRAFHSFLSRLQKEEKMLGWETNLQPRGGGLVPVTMIVGTVREAAPGSPGGSNGEPGRLSGLRWMLHDITLRKQTEAQLNYQAFLLENINDAVIATDQNFILTAWNRAAEEIYGWEAGEVIGRAANDVFQAALSEEERAQVAQILRETGQLYGEFRHRRKDGRVIHTEVRSSALRNKAGNLTGYVSVNRDITERKQAEERMAYQAYLLENVNDAIIASDENFIFTAWNRAAEEIYGWKAEEVLGRHGLVNKRTEISDEEFERVLQILAETGHYNGELIQYRRDGTPIHVELKITALKDETGRTTGYVSVNRDITKNRQAEAALGKSEARFRTIFESSSLGIDLVDLKGDMLESNPALREMMGYSEEELGRMNISDLTHPEDRARSEALFCELASGTRDGYRIENRFIHKDGNVVWVRLSISLVRDQAGIPQFAIRMIENITERKQVETELAEVQRRLIDSAEVERLHLAQDLHDGPVQDLYALTYKIEGLRGLLANNEGANQLNSLQGEIRQVISVLRNTAGNLRPPTLVPFGLEKAIRSHADRFQQEHPELQMRLKLMPDGQRLPEQERLGLFRIYQQSLVNVVRHAQANNVVINFYLDTEEVVLEIRDDGRGFIVPPRWIGFVREGHLGLAGAAERAGAMRGKLHVESQPGQGTLVRVVIPTPVE